MNRFTKISYLVVGSGLLAVAPVFADNTASNSETGAGSTNVAIVKTSNKCTLNQSNALNIQNNLTVVSNTGGNQANQNTGNGTVDTGNASATVDITNSGNSNDGTVDCAAPSGNNTATNSATGADSTNKARIKERSKKKLEQSNAGSVTNNGTVKAKTGKNKANKNTGNGEVDTGTATTNVGVVNDPLNTNVGSVGP